MKNKLLLVILFFVGIISYAQDLTPYSAQIMNLNISTSDLFSMDFQIRNIGGNTSNQNYTEIYISTNGTATNNSDPSLIPMGFVSTEQLISGQISSMVEYILPLPLNIPTGTYYVYLMADINQNVSETNESNNFRMLSSTINITQDASHTGGHIPYPILFVHGLASNGRNSWNGFADSILNHKYGWSNGGVLDFCLNADNNVCTGGPYQNEVIDFVNISNLHNGDYYFINFDIDANGDWWDYHGAGNSALYPCLSNQSGIVKQGAAVHWAINYIKSITGASKVILVGHSMGGLACREYLQSTNYNNDVAKLMECATPNKGSDAYFPGYPNGLGGIDWQSEADRDLKITYDCGPNGCYLWGGNEDASQINEECGGNPFYFYNVDVNCDGNSNCSSSSMQPITGLNYKSHPDINYSCVIGYNGGCSCNFNSAGGDCLVETSSANLYNVGSFSGNFIDTFWVSPRTSYYCANGTMLHTDINSERYADVNINALDESDYFDATNYGHAYDISFNTLYYGVIASKSKDPSNSNGLDYDDYKFIVTNTSNLIVTVYDVNTPTMQAGIYDFSQAQYSPLNLCDGKGNISFQVNNVPSGTYYLEISGIPTSFSWLRPYGFIVTQINATSVSEIIADDDIKVYPNPSSGEFNIEINSTAIFDIGIINELGELVYSENKLSNGTHKINLDELPNGVYAIRISNSENTITKKIIISR